MRDRVSPRFHCGALAKRISALRRPILHMSRTLLSNALIGASVTFALILHFLLNGHVHTVDTGHTFASKEECTSAGEAAKDSANLAPGEKYSFSCVRR